MKEIDARGLGCPEPVVLAAKALRENRPGEAFAVLVSEQWEVAGRNRLDNLP